MKKYILIILLGLYFNLSAQDSTHYLINNKPIKLKLFGGPVSQLGYLNQMALFSLGTEVGIMMNNKVFVQFISLSSLNATDRIILEGKNSELAYNLNQFGFAGGIILKHRKAIHLVPSIKMAYYSLDYDKDNKFSSLGGAFFYSPSLKVQLNLTRFMRLDFGTGYRFTNYKDIFITQNQVNGFEYQLGINLGRFAK
jgi:hypothetical protein